MLNKRKPLTDEQIIQIEHWADEKKRTGNYLAPQEKKMVEMIEEYRKNNWKGIRIQGQNQNEAEECQFRLERLKRKNT
ncbi:MAG: hypothetical protein NHB15_06620 [Methanosarcina barkeri]|nr:hypothetical protein [Methanosarcina sp. ERenArc_MAG2]